MELTALVADALAKCPGSTPVAIEEGVVGNLPIELTPAELQRLHDAVPKRRREFLSGRYYASVACQRFGLDRPTLPPDSRGAPAWPSPVVGSITHCDVWAAAAVARRIDVLSLGIDVEPAEQLPARLEYVVATSSERHMLANLECTACPAPDRLLFCVKEAVFKAWYPLTRRWLDFEDVVVDLRNDGTWTARGGRDGIRFAWDGGWSSQAALMATALVVVRR